MKISLAALIVCVVCISGVLSLSWRGKFCLRSATKLERRQGCRYRYWGVCCAYYYYFKCVYFTVRYCCRGWLETSLGSRDCSKPICNPPCSNGRCTAPGRCTCDPGYSGPTCGTEVCSYVFPCYPGTCAGSTRDSCVCATGYFRKTGLINGSCNKLLPSVKPEITNVVTNFREFDRNKNMQLYELIADATVSDADINTFWSNQDKFNQLEVNFESIHMEKAAAPQFPYYVTGYKMGIIRAYSQVKHSKIRFGGGSRVIAGTLDHTCLPPSWRDPEEGVYSCDHIYLNFVYRIEHDDIVTISVFAHNGGYRTITGLGVQQISGNSYSKFTTYKFDFKKPIHCFADKSCTGSEVPLRIVGPDIRRNGFDIVWDGWTDKLAGMQRYVWEIFRLQTDRDGFLLEPMEPMNITEIIVVASNRPQYKVQFTPPSSGMYSVILEASDRANNSEYVRRLVLFDNDSSISLNDGDDRALYISSASSASHFNWQGNITNLIAINWTNHFENKLYNANGLLNEVLTYRRADRLARKQVLPVYEDSTGERTLAAITNANGIVKFEVNSDVAPSLANLLSNPLPQLWVELPDVNQTTTLLVRRVDGDALRIWVRATDAIGNTAVDFTTVKFDTSPPLIETPVFRNQSNPNVKFSTMVDVGTEDRQSGSWSVRIDVMNNRTRQLLSSQSQDTRNTTNEICALNRRNCYTASDGHSYFRDVHMVLQHCLIRVPKSNLRDPLNLYFTAVNMALLENQSPLIFYIKSIKSLKGLEEYFPPLDIQTADVTPKSITLRWINRDNCYGRTGIHYKLAKTETKTTIEKDDLVRGDRAEMDINALNPDTNYTVRMSTMYNTDESDEIVFFFRTQREIIFTTGVITGLVIALILLAVVIVLAILLAVFWRRERVQVVVRRLTTRLTSRNRGHVSQNKFTNFGYKGGDDLYIYGNMTVGSDEPWVVHSSDLSLQNHLKDGRFASIYTAKLLSSRHGKHDIVIVKMLKANHSNDDEMLMKAKMNFLAKQIGQSHENVLGFIGGVVDDPRGPIIITEYCEEGSLKDWLIGQRTQVDERVLQSLYHFSMGIARGMEHLAMKKILHNKLAARNILLTSDLVPKITGFGPVTQDDGDNDNYKREKIPLKWVAPECTKSLRHASEKSDVWSYGVTLWEMFTFGDTPYSDIDNANLAKAVKGGYRLPKPEYCPDAYYGMMTRCWSDRPSHRPTFKQVVIEHHNMANDGGESFYS